MALTLDGSNNTIGGLTNGGLPDGCILDADINGMAASKLTGALPAISGASLTNLPAGGKFASYAVICDQKSNNTDGGTFTSGAWRTRDLNTELFDADGIVSISSNQFTLSAAGTYLIEFYAPAFRSSTNQARLYDITGSAVVDIGMTTTTDTGSDGDTSLAIGFARHTITSSNTYEIQHQCTSTKNTEGFGRSTSFDVTYERYTFVKIFKES